MINRQQTHSNPVFDAAVSAVENIKDYLYPDAHVELFLSGAEWQSNQPLPQFDYEGFKKYYLMKSTKDWTPDIFEKYSYEIEGDFKIFEVIDNMKSEYINYIISNPVHNSVLADE